MRTSPGCLPCKRRRKRCDLRKPICMACQRNFLICAWTSGRVTSGEDAATSLAHERSDAVPPRSSSSVPIAAPRTYPSNSLDFISKHPNSQFLFSHFIERTAPAVSTLSQGSNPFLQVLLPVALRSDMVLQATLALSGIHHLEEGCHSYSQTTWEHYAQALRSLKYGLTRFAVVDQVLALPLSICTLLFCFMEVHGVLAVAECKVQCLQYF